MIKLLWGGINTEVQESSQCFPLLLKQFNRRPSMLAKPLLQKIFTSFLSVIMSVAHTVSMADTIAVIGTGNVGAALGTEFAAQGHDIV